MGKSRKWRSFFPLIDGLFFEKLDVHLVEKDDQSNELY